MLSKQRNIIKEKCISSNKTPKIKDHNVLNKEKKRQNLHKKDANYFLSPHIHKLCINPSVNVAIK